MRAPRAMCFLVEEAIDETQPSGVERPVGIVIAEPTPAAGSAMNMA